MDGPIRNHTLKEENMTNYEVQMQRRLEVLTSEEKDDASNKTTSNVILGKKHTYKLEI